MTPGTSFLFFFFFFFFFFVATIEVGQAYFRLLAACYSSYYTIVIVIAIAANVALIIEIRPWEANPCLPDTKIAGSGGTG